MRVIVMLLGAMLLFTKLAAAADFTLEIDRSPIEVNYRETKQAAELTLKTTLATGLPDLRVQAHALKSGSAFASITFPGNQGRAFIDLSADPGRKDVRIPIEITAVDIPGVYEAQIDVSRPGATDPVAKATIQVNRPGLGFSPVIGGPNFKDGQVVVTTSGDLESPANFTIQIPPTNRGRDLKVEVEPPLAKYLNVTPNQLSLLPGGQANIRVRPTSELPRGALNGTIRISDAADANAFAQVYVSTTRILDNSWKTITLFLAVLAGALLSVLLNNVFPVSRAKRQVRQNLTMAAASIDECSGASPMVREALRSDASRLRLLNGSFSWYTTTKAEQIQEVDVQLKALMAAIGLAVSISTLRSRIRGTYQQIPVRVQEVLEARLSLAEASLVDRRRCDQGLRQDSSDTAREGSRVRRHRNGRGNLLHQLLRRAMHRLRHAIRAASDWRVLFRVALGVPLRLQL